MRTLRGKFLIILLPPVVIATIAVSAAFGIFTYDRLRGELLDKRDHLAESMSTSLAGPMWNFDRANIQRILDALALDRDVMAAAVFGEDEQRLAVAGKVPTDPPLMARVPIVHRGESGAYPLGHLDIAFSTARVTETIVTQVARDSLLLLFLVLTTVGSAVFANRVIVGRPLARLLDLIRRTRDAHRRERLDWRSNDEIGTVIAAYNEMVERLATEEAALRTAKDQAEDATRAKSTFLATMSHEIRTPMNAVVSMAELLDRSRLSAEQRAMAAVIRESATALLTVIDDILDFSKIEAGRLDLERVELDMPELIEGTVELLAPHAAEKGIEIIGLTRPGVPDRVWGDPIRIRQVLLNLAGNAVKFTQRGHVCIEAGGRDDDNGRKWLHVAVSDTGIGLSPDQQTRLFQAFSQADASTARRFGGTGLGLSISQRLVDLMDGRIGVDSALGQGARFWFEIPLEPATVAPETGPEVDLAGHRVLVVEANALARDAVAVSLHRVGAEVVAVGDEAEAARAAERAGATGQPFEVVLVSRGDAKAPRGTAGTALAAVGALAGAAFVLLSPPMAEHPTKAARQLGFSSVLSKPVRRRAVWRHVAAALGLAPLEVETRELGMNRYAPPPEPEAEAAGALILVAEDNPTNQLVIRELLGRLGYAHHVVVNGAEALHALERNRYGLLLTDCHMPEMDGYELAAAVRRREATAEGNIARLPMVALTADALAGTAGRCRDAGMDDCLSKPVEIARLEATVRRWLPQAGALRRPIREAENADAPSDRSTADSPPVDPEVLDLTPLFDVLGADEGKVRAALNGFVVSTAPLLDTVRTALAANDVRAARDAAHAAKGAAKASGAVRLGRLCARIQEALDSGDRDTAVYLADLLDETFVEVRGAVDRL